MNFEIIRGQHFSDAEVSGSKSYQRSYRDLHQVSHLRVSAEDGR